jgi:hypothetical protein
VGYWRRSCSAGFILIQSIIQICKNVLNFNLGPKYPLNSRNLQGQMYVFKLEESIGPLLSKNSKNISKRMAIYLNKNRPMFCFLIKSSIA